MRHPVGCPVSSPIAQIFSFIPDPSQVRYRQHLPVRHPPVQRGRRRHRHHRRRRRRGGRPRELDGWANMKGGINPMTGSIHSLHSDYDGPSVYVKVFRGRGGTESAVLLRLSA